MIPLERTDEDELEPYEYVPPKNEHPQARRNRLGKACCLAELDAAGIPVRTSDRKDSPS